MNAARGTLIYWILLGIGFALALGFRYLSIGQELPPFTFCDEEMFYSDVLKMLESGSWSASEFRSGPINTYPVFFAAKILSISTTLTDTQVLLLGRFLLPILLGSLAIFPIAAAARRLLSSDKAGVIAAAVFVSSQMLLGLNRIWYPDHYIVFFSAVVLYFSIRLFRGNGSWISAMLLGIAFALAIGVKYTALILVLPILIAFISYFNLMRQKYLRHAFRRSFVIVLIGLASAVVATLLIHLNTLSNFAAFIDAQKFNSNNYAGVDSNANPFEGMVAYSFVAFLLMLGLPGIIGIIAGLAHLIAQRRVLILTFLLSVPLGVIFVMGAQQLFINRNVMLAAPYLIMLTTIGIFELIRRLLGMSAYLKFAGLSLIAAAFLTQFAITTASALKDLNPESQVEAVSWISSNIPEDAVIGVNDQCSGFSSAHEAGRKTALDPDMVEKLEYYVFNSYWDGAIESNFRGFAGARYFLDQKYIHFSYYNDKSIGSYLPGLIASQHLRIPSGYDLLKRFDSNGPEIWILKRQPGP